MPGRLTPGALPPGTLTVTPLRPDLPQGRDALAAIGAALEAMGGLECSLAFEGLVNTIRMDRAPGTTHACRFGLLDRCQGLAPDELQHIAAIAHHVAEIDRLRAAKTKETDG